MPLNLSLPTRLMPNVPGVILILALLLTGCASTSTVSTKEPDLTKHPDVAGKTPIIINKPISRVRGAALEVLGSMNCVMKAEANSYLKGKCPTGENIEVFLQSAAPSETHVWIDTDFTYVGLLGQHNRNEEVVREMNRILSMDFAPNH